MNKLSNFFYDIIFPKKCAGCMEEGSWVCEKCFEKIIIVRAPFCPYCHRLTAQGQYCARHKKFYSLTGVIISAHYENPLKEAIHKFKYDRIKELVDPLSELLISRLQEGFPRGDLVLMSVPLSRERKSERGFNQAELLAQKVSEAFGIPVLNNILKRIRNNPAQIKLHGKERKENVKGIFRISSETEKIKNKTILLVDDVYTTGATLNEAGSVLKKAGAKNIWGLVLAKG